MPCRAAYLWATSRGCRARCHRAGHADVRVPRSTRTKPPRPSGSDAALATATSAPGLGSPLPHLHRNWAHPCHICTGTRLAAATSALGLGSPLPHLHRDWGSAHPHLHQDRTVSRARPSHICTGTGPTLPPCHICTGTGPTLPPCHICAGTGLPRRACRKCKGPHKRCFDAVRCSKHANAPHSTTGAAKDRTAGQLGVLAALAGEPSPGADVAGVSPVPVQMWRG